VAALALAVAMVVAFPAGEAGAGNRQDRAYLLGLMNQSRAKHQAQPLKLDAQLSRYARRHNEQMASRGHLFHTADLAAKLQGRQWHVAGENVGVGPSIDAVYKAFLNSPPHRRNILRQDFDHTAVGVTEQGSQVWVTLIFYG